MTPRVVIIGAGHNGLVTAFYLAKAGLRPIVLERRDQVGGAAITTELLPGFRVPTLAHAFGPLRPDVAHDLALTRRGIEVIEPGVVSFSPREDGRALVVSRLVSETARHIARWSPRDAALFPAFHGALMQGASLLADLAREIAPSIDRPNASELWHLVKTGRRFRGLGRPDAYRLLRMAPMPVADLAEDWFETDLLRAVISARGVFGTNLGPRSAGTVATLLFDAARNPAAPGAPCFVRGGIGRLTEAMGAAAGEAGAEIRTGAEVAAIEADDGGVRGVRLATGEEIPADVVVSNADPKRTLIGLVDPVRLDPGFLLRVRNIRARGTVAKVNLALSGLPSFAAAADLPADLPAAQALAGRIVIAPGIDYVEQAFDASKYGEPPTRPCLECVIPTLTDPGLAPDGRHVMSDLRAIRAVRPARAALGRRARGAAADGCRDARGVCAGSAGARPRRRDHHPRRSRTDYSFTGGHIHHGEMALDQLLCHAPAARMGTAPHADRGPVPVRRGHPSRRRHQRRQRRERRTRRDQGSVLRR